MDAANSTASRYTDWLYGGINFKLEGCGGKECTNYLSDWTKITETVFVVIISVIEIAWALSGISFADESDNERKKDESLSSEFHISSDSPPVELNCVVHAGSKAKPRQSSWPLTKRILLVALCLIFGIEIGYKFVTRSLIYLLYPCHILTFVQIYLLSADHQKKSKTLSTVFRIHLYLLNGVLLAMLFPVMNTLSFPFEPEIYWIQHILLYIIPIYLISLGGSYTPDPLSDMRWAMLSVGATLLYHFTFVQFLSIAIDVNISSMVCPAVSDPFKGEHYRKWAIGYQHLMMLAHQKLYYSLASILSKVVSTVQWFCIAVTLKMWQWTIRLCYISARACVRVSARAKIKKRNACTEKVCQSVGNVSKKTACTSTSKLKVH